MPLLLQLEDVPLGRKDSALDSLAAARRLVLQDEPSSVRVSDEVQQPAQRSSIARSSVHSVTSEPGTSAAMQAGPSAYQGPASPTDAEARLDFAEHLAPRQVRIGQIVTVGGGVYTPQTLASVAGAMLISYMLLAGFRV